MNILESLMNAQGGGTNQQLGQQLGQQFGLSAAQTQAALGALMPALAGAVQQNAQSQGGLESLIGALSGGQHTRYIEQPEMLGQPETVQDGNGILGHLFGSKDVSRALATRASAQTGIGSEILKRMLPIVATMVMGALAKQMSGNRSAAPGAGLGDSPGVGVGLGAGLGGLGGLGGLAGLGGLLGGGSASGAGAPAAQGGGGLLDMLTPLLDRNRDGSAMDDVLKMAAGFLSRR